MNSLSHFTPVVQDPINVKPTSEEKARLEYHIEQHGHIGVYEHECPMCESSWDCKSHHCRKPQSELCKLCSIVEFISDVKRLCEIVRSHMRALPYDPVMSKHAGWLEGLVQRAQELEVQGE